MNTVVLHGHRQCMYGLKQAGMEMNRKALSELAIADPKAFETLVETAKKAANDAKKAQ